MNNYAIDEMPADLNAEKTILGAIMLDNTAFYDATGDGMIEVNDFSLDSHRRIFAKIASLLEESTPVDPVTLCAALNKGGDVQEIGGFSYIANLTSDLPRKIHVLSYCKIVKDKSTARKLMTIASNAISEAAGSSLSALDTVNGAISALEDAVSTSGRCGAAVAEILVEDAEAFEREANREMGGTLGCDLFTDDISEMTSGIQEGELCMLCARPGQGKTEAAIQTILANAHKGKRIYFFSLEMTRRQVVRRMLRYTARIPVRHMRDPRCLTPDERMRIVQAREELADLNIYIDDTHELTAQQYRSRAVLAAKRWKADLLVVDYAQLLVVPRARNIVEAAPKQAETLRHIARDYCRTMALAQLRRTPPNDLNRFPDIEDILGSSAFEQAAQMILMLHRTRGEEKRYTGEDYCFIGKMRELQTIEPMGIRANEYGKFLDRYGDNETKQNWQDKE